MSFITSKRSLKVRRTLSAIKMIWGQSRDEERYTYEKNHKVLNGDIVRKPLKFVITQYYVVMVPWSWIPEA